MKKILLFFIILFLIPTILSQEYVITSLENNDKWWFDEMPILPKERGNLTSGDIICKIEKREPLYYTEVEIPTEQDKREKPEDIINNKLIFKRTLIGYYKCSNIKIVGEKEPEKPPTSIFSFKNIIIIILIIILLIGIMYAFSLKVKQGGIPKYE